MRKSSGNSESPKMDGTTRTADFPIPRSGDAIVATVGYSLAFALTVVAACNLCFMQHITLVSMIASGVWLLLVLWIVFEGVREDGGIRQYVINRFGIYSRKQCIRATPGHDAETISIGYEIFGRFLTCLTIDVTAISSIEWNSGQATAMAQRDMNDWHVALWFHHPRRKRTTPYPGMRDEEIVILGPSGPRAIVEAFGMKLIEFLSAAGVEFLPGRNEREFNTSRRLGRTVPDEPMSE